MKRKKAKHEEHADEAWLLPYSDLLTLLLALFIVMFAISNVDRAKFLELRQQFNVVFAGGSGIIQSGGKAIIMNSNVDMATDPLNNTSASDALNESVESDRMNEVKSGLLSGIEHNGYSDKVKIELADDGLHITIQDILLFQPGEADILEKVSPLLLDISKFVRGLDNEIRIVGHTDNVPMHSDKFRSNWDLSAYRAINVMNFMIEKGQVSPKKMSIQAYGEFNPRYDNSTENGRAKNRRVEIYIIRKYPVQKKQSR